MENIIQFSQSVSPIGVIAILVLIIYQMVNSGGLLKSVSNQNVNDFTGLNDKLDLIAGNHLSGLPELIETSKRLEGKSDKMIDLLTRIDAKMK